MYSSRHIRRYKNKLLNRLRGVNERLPVKPSLDLSPHSPLPIEAVAVFSEDDQGESDHLEYRDTSSKEYDSEEGEGDITEDLKEKLQGWVFKNAPTVTSVNDLMGILKQYQPGLPRNHSSLMDTPSSSTMVNVRDLGAGKFSYFGIQRYFSYLDDRFVNSMGEIILYIEVDGAALSSSSSMQMCRFWVQLLAQICSYSSLLFTWVLKSPVI